MIGDQLPGVLLGGSQYVCSTLANNIGTLLSEALNHIYVGGGGGRWHTREGPSALHMFSRS